MKWLDDAEKELVEFARLCHEGDVNEALDKARSAAFNFCADMAPQLVWFLRLAEAVLKDVDDAPSIAPQLPDIPPSCWASRIGGPLRRKVTEVLARLRSGDMEEKT